MPADLCDDIGLVDKANTFMASKSRINDDRMMRVRPEGSKYVADKFSVLERERMLGFPDGYVSEACKFRLQHCFCDGGKRLTRACLVGERSG